MVLPICLVMDSELSGYVSVAMDINWIKCSKEFANEWSTKATACTRTNKFDKYFSKLGGKG
jgi:hypothetical protein